MKVPGVGGATTDPSGAVEVPNAIEPTAPSHNAWTSTGTPPPGFGVIRNVAVNVPPSGEGVPSGGVDATLATTNGPVAWA